MAKSINPGNSISDLLFNPAFCVLGIPTPGAAYLRATTRYILRWTWYCNGALWRVSMPLSLKSSMESPGHHQVWSQNISFLFYSGTLSLSKALHWPRKDNRLPRPEHHQPQTNGLCFLKLYFHMWWPSWTKSIPVLWRGNTWGYPGSVLQ